MVPAVWLYVRVCVCERETDRRSVSLCVCVFVCLCHINLQKTLHVKFKLEYSVVAVSNSLMMLPPPDPHSCDQGAFNRDDKLFHSAFLMNYSFSACIRSSFSPTGPSLLNILLRAPSLLIHQCSVPFAFHPVAVWCTVCGLVWGLSSLLSFSLSVSVSCSGLCPVMLQISSC